MPNAIKRFPLAPLGAAILLLALVVAVPAIAAQRPDLGGKDNNWIPRGANSSHPGPNAPGTQDLTEGINPSDLVAALVGAGPNAPVVSNIVYSGALRAAGLFSTAFAEYGLDNGVILSSGNIVTLQGPNQADNTSWDNGQPGDANLNSLIPGYSTFDRAVLEFDLECQNTLNITFQYAFASEEYNEWVGSAFNDVFGFFLNGVNIAKLPPDFTAPTSINNVNCDNPFPGPGSHCILYQNNDLNDGGGGFFTEMDGFTKVIQANAALSPGLHHFKIAIADAGDFNLDSNVLIKGESLVCEVPVPTNSSTWGHVKSTYR